MTKTSTPGGFCRNCGAALAPGAAFCPNCGTSQTTAVAGEPAPQRQRGTASKVAGGVGKTIKWLLIAGTLLIVVIIIVAVIALGSAANDSEESSKQVSAEKYQQIKLGWSKQQVEDLVGKPESTDETAVQGLTMECWLYGVLASSGTYQFCFSNGKLDSKTRL